MKVKPVLRWAGGKTRVLPDIAKRIDKILKKTNKKTTFYDVFSGGGSITLDNLDKFDKLIMNDLNTEIINVYKKIRSNRKELVNLLNEHSNNHSESYYKEIRAIDRQSDYQSIDDITKAARTIYLNKTCFNGLYRVNSRGEFNVPVGKPIINREIYNDTNFKTLEKKLKKVSFSTKDFREILKEPKDGDIVYLDPPYDPYTPQSFVSYTKYGFSRKQQEELANLVKQLTNRNVYVILSNSATDFIRELYKEYIDDESIIKVRRSISADNKGRILAGEILIDNLKVIENNEKNKIKSVGEK